jgi:hypothetical protein
VEILKEAVPKISRIAILRNPNISTHIPYSRAADTAAKSLGVTVQFAEVQTRNDKELKDGFGAIINARANGLIVTPFPFFVDRRQQIANFAVGKSYPQSILVQVLSKRVAL